MPLKRKKRLKKVNVNSNEETSAQRTSTFGLKHGDTIKFDDTNLLLEQLNYEESQELDNWRIQRITTWGSLYCNGFQLEFQVKGKSVIAPQHYGNHNNPYSIVYSLDPGEYIIGMDGRCGNIMDTVTVVTNYRKFRTGTSNGGSPFSIRLPSGCVATSIIGGVGGHIHNIGLAYVMLKWKPQYFLLLSAADRKFVKTVLLSYNRLRNQGQHLNEIARGFASLPKEILLLVIAQCVPTQEEVSYS